MNVDNQKPSEDEYENACIKKLSCIWNDKRKVTFLDSIAGVAEIIDTVFLVMKNGDGSYCTLQKELFGHIFA